MPRKKKDKRELLLGKKRIAEQKRRENIKSDPALYAEYLNREKERYKKRKELKKLLLINELTPKTKNIQRRKWKYNQRNSRRTKKGSKRLLDTNTPPVSDSEDDPRINDSPRAPSYEINDGMLDVLGGHDHGLNETLSPTRANHHATPYEIVDRLRDVPQGHGSDKTLSSTSTITVVTLTNGNTLLIVNGYTFKKGVNFTGGSRWWCNEPSQDECNVYVHVNEKFELLLKPQIHHHEPVFCSVSRTNDVDEIHSTLDLEVLAAYQDTLDDDDGPEETVAIEEDGDGVALFVKSRKGHTILQYNGHRYRRTYKTKHGTRWNCSTDKSCPAFLYLNDNDEIIMSNKIHEHTEPFNENIDADQTDTAVVITSRKGKEMLLFRQFTYRRQYTKVNRTRWVCSTLKNCRACVFTDGDNFITSAFEEHCHDPPKYYLKPDHVLEAIREPVVDE